MPELNLNYLAIFAAVAGEQNISRAATKLAISQPAVSRQLAQLETNLGVTLFERLPRGVRLTHEGELLARYAREIFNLRDEAELALAGVRTLRSGRLRLAASTTIANYLLPEAIVRFKQKYPLVAVVLDVARSGSVERQVQEAEVDVGFVELISGDEGFDTQVIYMDQLVAVAHPGHPLGRQHRVTVEQIAREPFVVRDTGSDTKSLVERVLSRKGVTLNAIMSLGSTEAIKRAVAAGIGIAIVSQLSIELELRAKRLIVLPASGLSIQRPFHRLLRAGRPLSPASQAFLDILGKATQA